VGAAAGDAAGRAALPGRGAAGARDAAAAAIWEAAAKAEEAEAAEAAAAAAAEGAAGLPPAARGCDGRIGRRLRRPLPGHRRRLSNCLVQQRTGARKSRGAVRAGCRASGLRRPPRARGRRSAQNKRLWSRRGDPLAARRAGRLGRRTDPRAAGPRTRGGGTRPQRSPTPPGAGGRRAPGRGLRPADDSRGCSVT
jgi:hypothetical protein